MNDAAPPPVDEHHKYAYRHLLYWAVVEIRRIGWQPYRSQWINPFFWPRYIREARAAGQLAEWLHNLAGFSCWDFEHFDAKRFWDEHQKLIRHCPQFAHYRQHFECALFEARTGKWPDTQEQRSWGPLG